MAIASEWELKTRLDEIRLTCDQIEQVMMDAGDGFSHLDKTKCMQLARSIKDGAFEVNNYFAYWGEE